MYQSQLVKVEVVASILSVSKSHVWAQTSINPDFPKSIKLSARQTRWKLSDIDAYIEAKAATKH